MCRVAFCQERKLRLRAATFSRSHSLDLPCRVCACVCVRALSEGFLLHTAESETGQQRDYRRRSRSRAARFCIGFQCNFARASWPPPLYFSLSLVFCRLCLCVIPLCTRPTQAVRQVADIRDDVRSEHGRVYVRAVRLIVLIRIELPRCHSPVCMCPPRDLSVSRAGPVQNRPDAAHRSNAMRPLLCNLCCARGGWYLWTGMAQGGRWPSVVCVRFQLTHTHSNAKPRHLARVCGADIACKCMLYPPPCPNGTHNDCMVLPASCFDSDLGVCCTHWASGQNWD